MNHRPLSVPLGVVALVAATLAPTTSALAADSDIEFSMAAPSIFTANGQLVGIYDRVFDASQPPNTLHLHGSGGQAEGTLTVYSVATGKTLCQAESDSAHDHHHPSFFCVLEEEFPYGTTEIAAVVRSADGTQTSRASLPYEAKRFYGDSTISLDSYDAAAKTAHVSGNSLAGASFEIESIYYGGGEGPGNTITPGLVKSDGSWTAEIHDVEPATMLVFSLPGIVYGDARAFVPGEGTLPTPTVSVALEGDYFRVSVFGTAGTSATLRDPSGTIVFNMGTTPGTDSTSLLVRDPHVERTYTVTLEGRGLESEAVPFTLRKGEGTAVPSAPTVTEAYMDSARVTATIEAVPGAVVRVTDGAGTTVAVKVSGAKGRAQLAFAPDAAKAGQTYSVAQTVSGATSVTAPLVPAGS